MDALVYVQGFLEGSVKLATCLLYIAMLFSTSTFPIPTVQLLVTLGVGGFIMHTDESHANCIPKCKV